MEELSAEHLTAPPAISRFLTAIAVEARPHEALRLALAFLVIVAIPGCFGSRVLSRKFAYSSHYLIHRVEPGDTVYHIAYEYGVAPERLMALNHISDPRELRVGQQLMIPGNGGGAEAVSAPIVSNKWSPPRAARQFSWPVASGIVSSPFGMRHGAMHDGIDIDAPAGTPVMAADDGVVIYAGWMRGYGNVVIIHHSGNYVTVYAHNRVNLVRAGDQVGRGQEIARLGRTGRASGPNLHFEVRYDNQAHNPLAYLPTLEPHGTISFARNGGS
ncbi:MAG: peptidoglycan DD-metalloendopeptidase family protein [Candidatus Binataceae bacterium]